MPYYISLKGPTASGESYKIQNDSKLAQTRENGPNKQYYAKVWFRTWEFHIHRISVDVLSNSSVILFLDYFLIAFKTFLLKIKYNTAF